MKLVRHLSQILISLTFIINIVGCGKMWNEVAYLSPVGPAQHTVSNVWISMDDFMYPGGTDTEANAIALDSTGNVYSVGYGNDGGNHAHWLVRKSTGAGQTWTTVDDFVYSAGSDSVAAVVVVDASDNIFVAGQATNPSGFPYGVVRKSADHGATWTTVDEFLNPGGTFTGYNGMGVDLNGGVYAVGYGYDGGGTELFVVRKSSDHGATWSMSNSYGYTTGNRNTGTGMATDPAGNLYITDFSEDSSNVWHWIVQKSSDFGGTWTTVDDYIYNGTSTNTRAYGVQTDPRGNVFVGGYGFDGSGHNHGLMRKSADAGATWTTIQDYTYPGGTTGFLGPFGSDAWGNTFSLAWGKDVNNVTHWVVEDTKNNGGTWQFLYDFVYTGGTSSVPYGVAVDPQGNVYTTGTALDSTNVNHWITQVN